MSRFFIFISLLASSAVLGQQVSTNASVVVTSGGASAMAMGSASSGATTPQVSTCPCNDEPPKAGKGEEQFTCAQQKEFGKCDADFMLGFCECTCGRCCPCNDFPPLNDKFTCTQQKEFGKCDDPFMDGFCECECDRCPALEVIVVEEEPSQEPEDVVIPAMPPSPTPDPKPTPKPTPTPSPVLTPTPAPTSKCPPGSVPIFGSSKCETVRCAQNRQKCANGCGGLAEIKFDCKDVSDGNSSAFSSSCACAGRK